MVIRTLQETLQFDPKKITGGYSGPTKLDVPGYPVPFDVPVENLLTNITNKIANEVADFHYAGVYVVASMGRGKTKVATAIAHKLHTKYPKFKIYWPNDFENQEMFFDSLPKFEPVIVIFDDTSGAFKSGNDTQMHEEFSALTRVRHIIDPRPEPTTPVILIVVGHYSKHLEKEFRSVFGTTIYMGMSDEEMTNIKATFGWKSRTYNEAHRFSQIYKSEVATRRFRLKPRFGDEITFKFSDPFRCGFAITETGAQIFVTHAHDYCEICAYREYTRLVPAIEIFNEMKRFGTYGITAIQNSMFRHGHREVLPSDLQRAMIFIQEDLETRFTYDPEEMKKLIFASRKKKPSKRANIPRNENSIAVKNLMAKSTLIEKTKSPLDNFKKIEAQEPLEIENHNDLFFSDNNSPETITTSNEVTKPET